MALIRPRVTNLHDVLERLAPVLELAGQEIDKVVVGVDELGANAIALGWVRGIPVSAMELPKLLARNPRGRCHLTS